ncbi:hypothetical protein [Sphingomonas sp. DT-204]|uniref:hypothetical protein n=1 Tax=Sphingomonas sp. DT-204 TaxID=3396166 RepID=UPI003F1A7C76
MRMMLGFVLALGACDQGSTAANIQGEKRANLPETRASSSSSQSVETPTMRFLQLVGDMRLGAADRARLAEAEARDRAKDSAAYAKEDTETSALLTQFARANAIRRAEVRHQFRTQLHYGRAKLSDPLPIELLDRYDPVLVEDKARRELVTLADIRALDASNRFIARIAGVDAPDMTEKPGERAELQRRYMADASLRTALTHAGPRHAIMVAAIEGLPADKRAKIDRVIREQVHSPEDAANAARGAEHAVILAQRRKAQQARNAAALADFNRWIQQRNAVTLETARLDGMMRVLDTENTYFPR